MKKSLIASLAALALSAPVLAQTQPNPENPSDGLTIAKFNEVWQGYVGEAADKKITPQYVCFPNYCGYYKARPTKRIGHARQRHDHERYSYTGCWFRLSDYLCAKAVFYGHARMRQ